MTNGDLAASYLVKATIRLDVLAVLLECLAVSTAATVIGERRR